MRLLFTAVFAINLWAQPQSLHKTWYNKAESSIYFFYNDYLVKQEISSGALDTLFLNPVPKDYPNYTPIWYDNAVHLTDRAGGWVYRLEKYSTTRIDKSFQHRKQFQASQFVHNDTLFRYGGYGFWRANNFFTYFDKTTSEWEYLPIRGIHFPPEAYGGPAFLLDGIFYSLGGKKVDYYTGLEGEKNREIWTFNFSTRKWTNRGKTGVDLESYTIVQKDSLFFLFGHPSHSKQSAVLDLQNNRIQFYDLDLESTKICNDTAPFFIADTLLYYTNGRFNRLLAFRDFFTKPDKIERLYFDEKSIFMNLTYVGLFTFLVISLTYMGVTARRMRAPRLVRGGVRCNGVFYPLRSEEEAILGLLQSKPRASTDELLGQMARTELSDSQNNKRKVDAVISINKLFKKIANNTLIKVSKDTTDKRQHIYYLKRNVLS